MHPGSFTSGTESGGLQLIANGLAEIFASRPDMKMRVLLEHTAGQGTNLGHRFEHLAEIIDLLGGTPRVGVCLDTCHLIAAGYDICSEKGYQETFRQFGKIVGFARLKAFHLNDSKKPCGSRVDRHEHIGKGCLGLAPFRRILNDPRFAKLPMFLETPKEDTPETRKKSDVDPLDRMNLDVLRRLLQSPKTSAANR
jgi:deoxyribonuclease-4